MTTRERFQKLRNHPRFWHVVALKGVISLTFAAYLIDHSLAMPVSLIGNFIWLWIPTDLPPIDG